jgi:hypothetical protein
MVKEMNIVFVSDRDGYKTMWVDGERVFDDSDGVMIEDVLRVISHSFNKNYMNPAKRINLKTFNIYEASVSDIPDSVNDFESLESWHLDTFGKDIPIGW